ncbi:MAG: sel1 repeat family protein, partial [Geminicoccaceae bacterium]|nr:sel1 repeat family protein [Geminicoccaceae bacterium]
AEPSPLLPGADMNCRRIAAIACSLALLAGCTKGYEPTEIQKELLRVASDAEKRYEYVRARSEYRRLAENGVVAAQMGLADMLRDGRGGKPDPQGAAKWYLSAARAGDPKAMREVGRIYASGEGFPRDVAEAGRWFAAAAEAGDEASRHELAMLVLGEGSGGTKEAVAALKKAAANGYVPAQLELADRYRRGKALPQDRGEAQRWYGIAATSLEVEAANGDQSAKSRLADLYRDGRGVPRDGERAARMYAELAEAGRDTALVDLARLYRDGAGDLPADPAMAARYFARAAELGHASSAYDLGKMLYRGDGIPADPEGAATAFERAVSLGDDRALLYLGDIYTGNSGMQDPEKGAAYYRRSGLSGEPKGYFRLAELHERDRVADADPALALALYELAGEGGYSRGTSRAERMRESLDAAGQVRADALKAEIRGASLGR